MTNKSMILGMAALVIGGAILVPRALAYRGNPAVQGPNYTEERHEAMEKAFETNDYNSWKTLMVGKGRVTSVINAENFPLFAKAHELAEDGKLDEANKIRLELGLNQNAGNGTGNQNRGQGRGRNIL